MTRLKAIKTSIKLLSNFFNTLNCCTATYGLSRGAKCLKTERAVVNRSSTPGLYLPNLFFRRQKCCLALP
jgi:hypothetical protein